MSDLDAMLWRLSGAMTSDPTLLQSVIALLAAFVYGQVLAWVYERTYRGLSFSTNVTHTLILGAMSAALIMLAMQKSIVAGLGLLAALSMIRFRTTLKAPKDLVYVMAAVTLGIASGALALVPATVGCIAFAAVSLYLDTSPFASRARFDGVLRFRVSPSTVVEPGLTSLLQQYCRRFVLLNVGEVSQGQTVEHAYQIKLRSGADRESLLNRLRTELSATDVWLLLQQATLEY